MKSIGSAFENFAFKAFDFNGRATLLEYWLLMPLLWGFILFLFVGDVTEFWGFLLAREVPPLNPLYWDSFVVFFLTLIPRMSLTVRRLHDSGKSGKWLKLPIVTVTSGAFAIFFVCAGLATANITARGADAEMAAAGLGITAFMWMLVTSSADTAWDAVFTTAALINSIGFDAIFQMIAALMTPPEDLNIGAGVAAGMQEQPVEAMSLLLILGSVIGTPIVAGLLHIFFMISPTKPDHDLDNTGPMSGASLRRKGDVSDNPFAGYKYLYAKSAEQEAANREKAKEEIKSLYQQRVLGSQQPT